MAIIDSINTLLGQQKILLDRFTSKEWVEKLENTISGIKTKVDAAISPNDILTKMLYVSTSAGDEKNIGDKNNPLKTIKAAIDLIPINGCGEIILLNTSDKFHTAQIFLIDSDIIIKNKTIIIKNEEGVASKNIIKFGYSSDKLIPYKFKLESNINLSFNSVDIQSASILAPDKARIGTELIASESIIELNNVFGVINFFNSTLTINDFNLINSNAAGFSDVGISVVGSIIKQIVENKYLAYVIHGIFKISSINNNITNSKHVSVNISDLVKDVDSNTSMITFIPSGI